jgi:hypothetical protein
MGGRSFLNQSFYTNFWYPDIESILLGSPWPTHYVGTYISGYLRCIERISDDE